MKCESFKYDKIFQNNKDEKLTEKQWWGFELKRVKIFNIY